MIDGKLFKWVGGKKWLSPILNDIYSENIKLNEYKYYIEPFSGGLGSFLFTLPMLVEKGIETVILNDINSTLINTYKSIKNKKNKVFKEYWKLETEYKKTIPLEAFKLNSKEDKATIKKLLEDAKIYFYSIRTRFNEIKGTSSVEEVACFLFLSQHSFNGLYRENLSGFYNSPYNWETGCPNKTKKRELIEQYSNIFKTFNIIFENKDVFKFLKKYKKYSKEAVFYFDPPYKNKDIAETKYNKDHFCHKSQDLLLKEYKELDNVLYSNHYLQEFENFSKENGFEIRDVYRVNVMNSDVSKRSEKKKEILSYKFA